MSDDNNAKYGGNARNLWRKVYGYQNNKPQVVSIVDPQTQVTYSLDLNKTLRHRDYFIIKGVNSGTQLVETGSVITEYDEGVYAINSLTDQGTGSFNFTFSSNPYVVLTVESASLYGESLNLFGGNITTSGFTFGLSAPFTGSIRWRAIYATSYPAYVTSAYTASITASAGAVAPLGQTYYTASFATLPGVPFKYLDTSWEYMGISDGTADVALTTDTLSANTATVEISAPSDATIEFIAFYDGGAPTDFIIDDSGDIFSTDGGDELIHD